MADELNLDEYQPGQWWLDELRNISVLAEPTPDMVRAAKVACDFAQKVFVARAAPASAQLDAASKDGLPRDAQTFIENYDAWCDATNPTNPKE